MTERLYYTDAGLLAFDATVVETLDVEGRQAVVLDRTAFYPTSGGQPHDTGQLGDVRVVDVVDDGDRIIHVLESLLEVGTSVRGVVDPARRLDHRQQHTGQHVLSAAFDRVFSNRTVGFHMGTEVSTVDLSRVLSAEDVERAVDEANRVVWEDRAVTVRFADAAEAQSMGLRKESSRDGQLRLVEVADFDLSACGGTHVDRTGAIGLIAVTATEKFKGGLRVTFVCGGRALRSMRGLRDAVAGSVRVLSVVPAELPAAIQKLLADMKVLRKRVADLQVTLAVHEAERLLAIAAASDTPGVIGAVLDGWDAAGLKSIGSALIARAPVVGVLVAGSAVVAVAHASTKGPRAVDIVQHLTSRFGGRGGGTGELAQAGGLTGAPTEIVAAAVDLISLRRSQ
ncbi:MAG TPA: alanyl-tRNA editing protein [Vicinamibacterales bacterium]